MINEGGLKAGLLHKKNRGETVSMVLTLHYGNPDSLKDQTAVAGMLPGMMMAGTKKHDRQSLREELDSLGILISSGGGGGGRGRRGGRGGGGGGSPGQLSFSVQAKRDTLPKALELLGEILREPAFPVEEFETSKLRMASMLSSGRTEPAALSRNKLSRASRPMQRMMCGMCRRSKKPSSGASTSHLSRSRSCMNEVFLPAWTVPDISPCAAELPFLRRNSTTSMLCFIK